ncbi:MAG: ATP-binding protein, partial [Acidobacteriota bacterium]
MPTHVDPILVAGFAAEVRSHLPQIREALDKFQGSGDAADLGTARSQLEGMRDASAMVGLEPLGRALEAFLGALGPKNPGNGLGAPLNLLNDYLERLEGERRGDLEPEDLLRELGGGDSDGTVVGASSPPQTPPPDAGGPELDLPPWMKGQAPGSGGAPAEASGTGEPGTGEPGIGELGAPPSADPPRESAAPAPRKRIRKRRKPSLEVQEIFAAEADEHAQAIAGLLAKLRGGAFRRGDLADLRRRVHNLKGSAALVRKEGLSRVAHAMEDLFDDLYENPRDPSAAELAALEQSGDALQALIYRDGEGVDVDGVVAAFSGGEGAKPAPEPAAEGARATGTASDSGTISDTVPEPAADAEASPEAEDEAEGEDDQEVAAEAVGDDSDRRRFVRVSVEALDEAVRYLAEVEAERHLLRDLLSAQRGHSQELDLTDRRLRREVRSLESDLELAALSAGQLPQRRSDGETSFDDLEWDRYTELHERSRALIESAGDLETVRFDLDSELSSMQQSVERLEGVTDRLRDRLLGLRLVPFGSLGPRLEGMVREAARSLGKSVRLEVADHGVELDKDILDALVSPLDHLLRNAVAHGVESAEQRREQGKPATALVTLEANYSTLGVQLRIHDDGAGIDLEKVRRRALQRRLIGAEEAEGLTPDQIRGLIFEPGLSTSAQVDHIAGRGVGMDVVRQRLRELRGQIDVDSTQGEGTQVTLDLPTSLAVQRVLMVADGGYRLAVPSAGIDRLERVDEDRLQTIGGREVFRSDDTVYRVVRLARDSGLPDRQGRGEPADGAVALLTSVAGRPVAYLVERVLGGREVVVQDLGRHLQRVPGILGVTHTGVGHPVPILDPAMWAEGQSDLHRGDEPLRTTTPEEGEERVVMVVDDSLSMRRYLGQLVGRLGYRAVEARDGQDALELLEDTADEPSLVLLDLEMPRMAGYELMERLRSDRRFQHVPRVVLSSRGA